MKKTFMIIVTLFLCCTYLVNNANAFHEKIDSISTSQNTAVPQEGLLGQNYKYALSGANTDNPKYFAVFSTTYSIQNVGQTCILNEDWDEATRAGIAKIIDEYNFPNNGVNTVNNNVDLLNKNLQLTLTINQFLIDKNNGSNDNKILNNGEYTNPKKYFSQIDGIDPNKILNLAESEYERVKAIGKNGENVKIDINRDDSLKKVIYDSSLTSSISSSVLEIETKYIDKGTLTLRISNQTFDSQSIPEGVQIKAYVSTDENNFGDAKAILDSSTNSVNLDEVPDSDKFYVKFELIDSRTDKSGQFIVTPAAYLTGKFEYRAAAEYSCGDNTQKLTPNRAEIQKVIVQNLKGFSFKTPGIPDYPILQIVKTDKSNSSVLLNNAEYKISYTVNGEQKQSIVKTGEQGIDGKVLFENIENSGEYCIEEITPPAGYILDNTKHCFNVNVNPNSNNYITVTEDDDAIEYSPTNLLVKVTLNNKKNGVTISIQDITTKKELSKAHLILKNEQGETVENGDWISSGQPRLFTGLKPGTYYITELEAPEGYSLNEEVVTFTIDDQGNITGNTIMYNTHLANVPFTASFKSIMYISVGILFVAFGIIMFTYLIKKRKQLD